MGDLVTGEPAAWGTLVRPAPAPSPGAARRLAGGMPAAGPPSLAASGVFVLVTRTDC